MTTEIFDRLKTWREDRNIHLNEYNKTIHSGFIAEELTELIKSNTTHDEMDAFCDLIVFSINAIESAGYDAEVCMGEVLTEIESRQGSIVNGKFEKYRDEDHTNLWYKADFDKAIRTDK